MPEHQKTNWILIAAIFVAGLFAAAQFGKLTLSLQAMQAAYLHSPEWVPSLVSIVGIVGLIFGVVAGPFVARIGLSRIMLISLVIGAAVSLFQALMPPIWLFAISRVVEGFSHLGMVIAGPTLIAVAASDRDRPFAMGIWAAFFGASLAITAYLMPSVLSNGGLPLLFGLHGIGMLVVCGVLFGLLPKTPPESMDAPNFFRAYKRLYTAPNLLIPGAGFVWYTGIYIALIAVLPLALDLKASVIAVIPLISIAGTLGAGSVARYIAPHHLSNIGFVASAVLMIVIQLGFHDPLILYVLFFLMGAIPTGAFAAIAYFNDTTETRARATGGITHLGNVGTTLGTPIMVLAFQAAGLIGVTIMVLLCCLGGLASLAHLSRQSD